MTTNATIQEKTPYEIFQTLPQDVRDAYYSVEYEKTLEDIAKKYKLHLDQADALSNETYRLMLSLTHPPEFIGNISRRLNVPSETAKMIAGEINERILRPIRASLMKIHKMIEKDQQEEDNDNDAVDAPQEPAPERISLANVAEEKLKASFTIPQKTSGYTGSDPYREEV